MFFSRNLTKRPRAILRPFLESTHFFFSCLKNIFCRILTKRPQAVNLETKFEKKLFTECIRQNLTKPALRFIFSKTFCDHFQVIFWFKIFVDYLKVTFSENVLRTILKSLFNEKKFTVIFIVNF